MVGFDSVEDVARAVCIFGIVVMLLLSSLGCYASKAFDECESCVLREYNEED